MTSVVDAVVCGLLPGIVIGLLMTRGRWLHVFAFFLGFYVCQLFISGMSSFAELVLIALFLWLFPLSVCLTVLLTAKVKSRAATRV